MPARKEAEAKSKQVSEPRRRPKERPRIAQNQSQTEAVTKNTPMVAIQNLDCKNVIRHRGTGCKHLRKMGIELLGDSPWGTHFCQFYQTKEDLIHTLVPYFKAGLENNEFCMWVTSKPLNVEDAKTALKKEVRNLDNYLKKGQIEILDHALWYTKSGRFDAEELLAGWVKKETQALEKGFEGLRLSGNTFWLEEKDWKSFADYEAAVNSVIGKYRMLAICTYYLDKCTASEIIDVVSNHQFAVIKQEGKWGIIGSAEYRKTAEALRQSEQKFRLAFENAVDAIFWADPETGLITNCNKAAEILLEKEKEDIIGQNQTKLHPPEKAAFYQDLFKKYARIGRMFTRDAEVITSSGKTKPVSITASATSVGGKQIIQGIFRDITDRKQAEENIFRQKELLENTLESLPHPFYVVDANDYTVKMANSAAAAFGTVGQISTCYALTHKAGKPCTGAEHPCPLEQVKKTKKPVRVEHIHYDNDGRPRNVEVYAYPLFDREGNVTQVIEYCLDITEQKKAEQALQKAHDELERKVRERTAELLQANKRLKKENQERMRTERSLKLEEARLDALLHLSQMSEASVTEIAGFTLDQGVKLTRSKIGFLGFLSEDESIYTLHAVSKDVVKGCGVASDPVQWHIAEAGIWADAIRRRQTLFVNDYSRPHTSKKGLPAGHPPVDRLMVVPVFEGKRIVAVAGVGNKASDYDKTDERQITLLLSGMWGYVQRNRAREALERAHEGLEKRVGERTAELEKANAELEAEIADRKQAEAALRESENKYRTLLKNIPQKIFYKDLNSAYVLCNDSFAEDLNIKPKEIKGKTDYDLFPKELAEKYRVDDRRIISSGRTLQLEEKYLASGHERTVHTLKAPIKGEKGNVIGLLGIFWDITDRKQAEEALRESERQLSTRNRIAEIFLTVPDDEMYAEVLQVLLEAMESKYGIFGYIDEHGALVCPSMTRDIWDQCQVPDKTIVFPRERWGGIWGRALKEKKTLYANEGLHVPEGHVPVTRVLVVPIMYSGEAIGVLEVANKDTDYGEKDRQFLEGIADHIAPILNARLQRDRQQTERKKAEEALRKSEKRYRELYEASHDGYALGDMRGNILEFNSAYKNMLGYSEKELLQKTYIDLTPPKWRSFEEKIIQEQVLRRGYSEIYEKEYLRKDGTIVPIELRTCLVKDDKGKPIGMWAFIRDITERKEAEARRLLTEKILSCLNQEKTSLDIIVEVLTLIKEFTGFEAVGMRLRKGDDFPYFAVQGFSAEFVEAENYLCVRDENGKIIRDLEGRPFLECMCGNVLSGRTDPTLPFFTEGGSFWTNSTTQLLASTSAEEQLGRTRNRCNQAGYESMALIPLRSGDQIIGLLQLNDIWPGRLTPEMVCFFEGIAASIAIALARIKAEEQARNLAKFPSESPFPVLRIAQDGTILYSNEAGLSLLNRWNCQVGEPAPEDWRKLINKALTSTSNRIAELEYQSRIFSFTVAPVREGEYANIYGYDVTEQRKAEQQILKLNKELEQRVADRTTKLTKANRRLLQEIEQRKRLEKDILDISEREQRLIGQELHDSVGQQFTGIAFMAKAFEQKLAGNLPEEAATAAKIAKLINEAAEQARDLAKGLHPVDLSAGNLTLALQELAATTERLFGVLCTLKCDKSLEIDDTAVAVHLYRITQEAITNAIKHGMAKNIQIALTYGRDKAVLTIKSDGMDFPKGLDARGTGMGLQIMDHRADIIGGSLNIHRAVEGGTIVTCVFPNKKH